MVIQLRRLPMLLRVLCVLLAVLLLACTVFAPVARAEALTATIALLGGAALVSGVLAAAGLKASDSAAWNSWCSQIAASDSVRSAAQALSKITLPAAKLVALVYAGKTYVSRALQRAIINEAITAGAYAVSDGLLSFTISDSKLSSLGYSGYTYALYPLASVSWSNFGVTVTSSSSPVYVIFQGYNGNPDSTTSDRYGMCFSFGEFSVAIRNYNGKIVNLDSVSDYISGLGTFYSTPSYFSTSAPESKSYMSYCRNSNGYLLNLWSIDGRKWIANMLYHGTLSASDAGIEGVIQQDGAITDPIGKDVIGSLDDLKTKVADWSNYLDTGIDVAIDGAVEGVASEAVPSLPVTIPTTGQQGAQTYPDARTGTTDSTIINTGTSTASVAQNQGVVSKLLSDVLDYLKPDTGFWDKFPLCIPYDMYLFVASLSGKDMSDSSIFSASPGNLPSAAAADAQPQNDWQPIINIDQDWDVSGVHIPWHITLDLTPFLPLFEIIRLFIGASFIFGLYWYEWHRIKEDS
jgi:hypothetical protein